MSKMIQLRHVPEALHRRLKARPSAEEIMERLQQRSRYRGKTSPTEIIREERDRR